MNLENRLRSLGRSMLENRNMWQYADPPSMEQVRQAEKQLRVHFPMAYSWFLVTFGTGFFGWVEIFGLWESMCESKPWGIPDVVTTTQILREKYELDETTIALAGDRNGFYYITDVGNSGRLPDSEVWVLNPENGEKAPIFKEDGCNVLFSDFLEGIVIDSVDEGTRDND